MSQNPNDGPNYNPYGPNPANPNYPPQTAYGAPPPPPSGPNPGYAPNPPSGPSANTPPSSYGAYDPYAPPPPPGVNPGSNPYDPYAPTMMSQNPISAPNYPGANPPSGPNYANPPSNPGYPGMASSPGYPAYAPQMGAPGQVTQPPAPVSGPPTRNRGMVVLISIIALVVILGGGVFAAVAYNNNQQTQHANATATANAIANANATVGAKATATAIANTYPFSSKLVLNDPMVDNSKGMHWDNNKSSGCYFDASAYHVIQADAKHYNTCAATGTNYSDFTFETEMVIKKGDDASAGGLLFRADENNNKFYRLSVDTTGNYFILVIVDTTGTGGNARELKTGVVSSFNSGLGATNTLAIVARGNTYSFYVNQQLVSTFTDSTYSSGQIGFDADYGNAAATELVFTNVKVWQL